MKPTTPPEPVMDEKRLPQKTCRVRNTGSQGHANRCCCYIMDEGGRLVDPCYYPMVDGCL